MTRVRFAPAPTGYLHVGSARTALFNWLYARSVGGTFVLRIEDTDRQRSSQPMIDQVLRTLDWLGLEHDEGPILQSERNDLYLDAVQRLLDSGQAYYCDLTPEQVAERAKAQGRAGYDGYSRDRGLGPGPGRVVRFRTPDEGQTVVDDLIRGEVVFDNAELEDFVIARGDGTPVFLVANAVDDTDMGMTHVIRGEDLLNTTPKVMLLMAALGQPELPAYAHLPLIVNEQKKKLSKRRDDVAVEHYRERGYLPEAVVNYLALLGWGPRDDVEVRPIGEIIEQFRLTDVSKGSAVFDPRKFEHVNAEWIRRLDPADLRSRLDPWLTDGSAYPAEAFDGAVFEQMQPVIRERLRTLADAPALVDFLFLDELPDDPAAWDKAAKTPDALALLDEVIAAYEGEDWSAEALHARLLAIGEAHGLKLGKAQAPVRVAVTGRTVGPPLFESLEALGRARTLERLRAGRERLAS